MPVAVRREEAGKIPCPFLPPLARISHKLSAADFAARWTVISSLLCPGKVENTPVDNCPRQRCPFRPSALLQTSQLETRVGPPASARILA
jgi:hypothetical protein